jgi:hypothetical protein
MIFFVHQYLDGKSCDVTPCPDSQRTETAHHDAPEAGVPRQAFAI